MNKAVVLEGICLFFNDQGSGSHWAFQDSRHISSDGKHDFNGLWTLKDGDRLQILDRKKKVLWSGFIAMKQRGEGRPHQRGVAKKEWNRWFRKEYPARFTPGPNQKERP